MSVYVLTRPQNATSAVKLGHKVVVDSEDIPSGSAVIRWGNGTSPEKRGWELVLNKRATLELSTNKLLALQTMARVVKTPEIYVNGDTLPRGHKYVVRPEIHAEGSDFQLVDGGRTLTGHHATRFIPDTREYRVWFVRGNYLVAKRIPRSSEGQSLSDPCRSKWAYSMCDGVFPKLAEEMGKARQAIPLDFGAVDVLWKDGSDGEEGKWYFLEFNSAPSLDTEKVLAFFKRHLNPLVTSSLNAPETRQNAARTTQTVQEVPEVVHVRENAANRQPASRMSAWEAAFRQRAMAEKAAKERAILDEIYGS